MAKFILLKFMQQAPFVIIISTHGAQFHFIPAQFILYKFQLSYKLLNIFGWTYPGLIKPCDSFFISVVQQSLKQFKV